MSEVEATRDDYDPFIVVAANRQMVRLRSGFTGRLIYWSRNGNLATVVVAGRHVRVTKDQIVCVIQ